MFVQIESLCCSKKGVKWSCCSMFQCFFLPKHLSLVCELNDLLKFNSSSLSSCILQLSSFRKCSNSWNDSTRLSGCARCLFPPSSETRVWQWRFSVSHHGPLFVFRRPENFPKCEIKKNLSTWLNIISTAWLHNSRTLYRYLCIKLCIHWFRMVNVLPAAR